MKKHFKKAEFKFDKCKVILITAVHFIYLSVSTLFASGSSELVNIAEEAWNNKNYNESAQLYKEISEKYPSLSDPAKYNQALSLYKNKEYELIENTLSGLTDLKSTSLLGLNSYKRSESFLMESGDIDSALKEIEKSISWFQRSVQLDLNNKENAHNLELSKILKKTIEQYKEEQQNQEQQNQENKNKLGDLKEEQDELASDSQKGADDHQEKQKELNKKTEELKNEMSGNDEVQQDFEKAREMQDKALERMNNGQHEEAGEFQQKAADALNQAREKLKTDEIDNSEENKNSNEDNTGHEKEEIAQSIIENENNRETSIDKTGGINNVDRNW